MNAEGGESTQTGHGPAPISHATCTFFSTEKNSPRIDTACKWLLDELGGPDAGEVTYRDDRQMASRKQERQNCVRRGVRERAQFCLLRRQTPVRGQYPKARIDQQLKGYAV